MMRSLPLILLAGALLPLAAGAPASVHFMQKPAMNKTQIVFSYAGDLWTVSREGGSAVRLTSGVGVETDPVFSPDGNTIAFTGEYDGNVDVFTMPATGGVPKRMTYHPSPDRAVGWTPDGKRILFRSDRDTYASRTNRLYTVPVEGGLPTALPLPLAFAGSYSPDGARLVYAPLDGGQFGMTAERFVAWKRYRGGTASYLWVVNLSDLSTVKVPRTDSNDIYPMWVGDKIYFLSDRGGPMTLYRYDTKGGAVTELVKNDGHWVQSASAGPGGIVYEQFGQIFIYDTGSGKVRQVPIQIAADLAEVRPHFANVSGELRSAAISPTGVRAVFEAHGDILTVPAEKGDIRNLTRTPGVMERTPVWSPDGQSVAYFSDESGEYALHVKDQGGFGEPKKFALAGDSAFYFSPVWSPDSKHVAFFDNKTNVWDVAVDTGKVAKVDSDYFYSLDIDIAWSPDSKWITYSKFLPNRMHSIWVYSLESGKGTQISDGMSDARYPAFDRDGKYLYFTASTNYGPTSSGLDMTSDDHPVTRSVYLAVLPKDTASPLAPESDEEKAEPADKGSADKGSGDKPKSEKPAAPKPVVIDFDGLATRVVAVSVPARDYIGLTTGKAGFFYLSESPEEPGSRGVTLSRYDLKKRKLEKLADNVSGFDLSANGEKMLLRMGGGRGPAGGPGGARYVIVPATQPVKAGEGTLNTSNAQVFVDPVAEWKQMYHDVWRIEKSYFYDPNLHGVDAAKMDKEYAPYLDDLGSRADLNYLFHEMLGEITSGHLRGGGGSIPEAKSVPGGLLGADFEIANGRYRFQHIYSGESWNPQTRSPLVQPGINVAVGDYLLAVDGVDLAGSANVYQLLEGKAGKQVMLRVGSDPSGTGSREVKVVPVENERQLRYLAWIEGNRRKVDTLSNGQLAYVHLPDTAGGGLTNFHRYYFAQVDKKGAILDERFNGGGQAADYIINVLDRQLFSWWSPRYGAIYRTPAAAVFGPKVMIINELAGSGGDMMPWMFRYSKTGTLVGKRTWGGLIGVSQYPALMDGGAVTAPNFGFFSPKGEWDVENHGTSPDIEVELDPKAVAEGKDPQLERAVAVALEQLKKNPPPEPHRPPFPNYQNWKPAAH